MFASHPVRIDLGLAPGSHIFVVPSDGEGIFSGTLREQLSILSVSHGRVLSGPVVNVALRHSLPGIPEKRFFAEVCWYNDQSRCFTTFEEARRYWWDTFGSRQAFAE